MNALSSAVTRRSKISVLRELGGANEHVQRPGVVLLVHAARREGVHRHHQLPPEPRHHIVWEVGAQKGPEHRFHRSHVLGVILRLAVSKEPTGSRERLSTRQRGRQRKRQRGRKGTRKGRKEKKRKEKLPKHVSMIPKSRSVSYSHLFHFVEGRLESLAVVARL